MILRAGSFRYVLASLLFCGGAAAEPIGYEWDIRSYNLARGRIVFTEHCMRCHEQGRKGAPVIDDVEDWRTRIQQPLATLINHALEGHGDMPPKGELDLTDDDVASAVAYAVHRSRILGADVNVLPASAAGSASNHGSGSAGDALPESGASTEEVPRDSVVNMLLMWFSKDRWK